MANQTHPKLVGKRFRKVLEDEEADAAGKQKIEVTKEKIAEIVDKCLADCMSKQATPTKTQTTPSNKMESGAPSFASIMNQQKEESKKEKMVMDVPKMSQGNQVTGKLNQAKGKEVMSSPSLGLGQLRIGSSLEFTTRNQVGYK